LEAIFPIVFGHQRDFFVHGGGEEPPFVLALESEGFLLEVLAAA
jgi:hypothetical protein